MTEVFDDENQPVRLLDSAGRAVFLPRDHIDGFARLAVPSKDTRIPVRVKRFHIGNIFKQADLSGHPQSMKAAIFDIITPDLEHGLAAGVSEAMCIVDECVALFPGMQDAEFEVVLTHTKCTC